MSRPAIYTPELAQKILDELVDGRSLRKICEDPGMPSRSTVLRWQDADPSFDAKCARAREAGGELFEDKVNAEADGCTEENAQSKRVRISAYQWIAAKLAPKKYGERLSAELAGPNGGPIQTVGATVAVAAPNAADAMRTYMEMLKAVE